MGKVIKKKIQGMNWLMKSGFVLLLTLATTVFMYEGWYKPLPVLAAPVTTGFTSIYHAATALTATSVGNITVPAGSNRMLVVAFASQASGSGSMVVNAVTYGGVAMTSAGGDAATSLSMHTQIYYLKDNAIMNGNAQPLVVNITGGGTSLVMNDVWYAIYTGVDQTATPVVQTYNSGSTTVTSAAFASGLVIPSNGAAALVAAGARATATVTYVKPANFTVSNSQVVSTTGVGLVATSTTAATDTASFTSIAGGPRWSQTGISIAGVVADLTPPTASTVTVTPDISSTYTSSAPTISTVFTDTESAVTSCNYTTDDSTWIAGVVSGTGPYTCMATPTGLSGSLNINMQATSSGGTASAVGISRTADATAPSDGALTVVKGDTNNSLSWTSAIDSGGGTIASYILRYATGATAPANCSSGTAVSGSPFSSSSFSTTHSSLTNGTQYSYRLCATDTLGNTSTGVTGSATPAADPTKISSCTGCHFNSGIADAGTRGSLFQGSHGKHAGSGTGQYAKACTTCHISNINYNHANGKIDMANVTYSKTASFAVSDGVFSGGTCSATSCHSDGTSVIAGTATTTSPAWGGTATCTSCHGVGGNDDGRPNYPNGTPKRNSHGDGASYGVTHKANKCSVCHDGIGGTTGAFTIISTAHHNNGAYNIRATLGYTQATGTCATAGCHGSVAWGGQLGCIDCHNAAITSPIAQALDSTVTLRRSITTEFGNPANHLRTKGAVTSSDCGVCHMEGNAADGSINSAYHKNGYVELRDPQTGTTIKTKTFSGTPGTYSADTADDAKFVRFSRNLGVQLEAETATIPGTTVTNFQVLAGIQVNHCLKCHSSTGATSSLARISTGVALKPFNNASTAVNVNSQFATTNRSYHPVLGKQNNSYVQGTRMNAPWNITKTNANTTSYGYLMSCWDCHATPADTGTISSTVTAHGSTITAATGSANSVEIRGVNWRTGTLAAATNNTFCIKCHAGYDTSTTTNHSTGSAFGTGGSSSMSLFLRYGCTYCHSTSPNATAAGIAKRRSRSADVHGYETLYTGAAFTAGHGYAFIRSTILSPNHIVKGVGATAYTPTCGTGNITITNGTTSCSNGMGTYTVGGVY